MKKLVSFLILGTAILAAATQVQGQTQPTPNNVSRVPVSWSDPSRPGLVKVSGFAGTISVRTHAGKDVIVESSGSRPVRSRNQSSSNTAGLTLISPGRGPVISEAGNVITVSNANWADGNSQLDIQVPARTNLKLTSTSGRAIAVDGVEGDIDVTNMSGDIRLTDVAGSVVVSAHNGKIFATIRELTPSKMMSFVSFNSHIDVTVPSATKANVRLRSDNGEAWSDFTILPGVTPPPTGTLRNGRTIFQSDRAVNGTINGGGPDIEIRTFNGNIYLRKGK